MQANTEVKNGNLIIRKAVTHDFETTPEGLSSKTFTVKVKLTDESGNALADRTFDTAGNTTVTTDSSGYATLEVKDGTVITLTGIPEGTVYTVAETNIPAGFTLVTDKQALTGSITSEADSVVTLLNDYEPQNVPTSAKITVHLDKFIKQSNDSDLTDWGNYAFSFNLERMKASGEWEKIGNTQTVSESDRDAEFILESSWFDSVGTHYFRVIELDNTYNEIVNDTPKYFEVVVVHDVDSCSLKVDSVNALSSSGVTVNNVNSVDTDFTNKYVTSGEAMITIPIEKHLTNTSGIDVGLGGFRFELDPVDQNKASTYVTTNDAGEAVITMTYNAVDFEGENLTGEGLTLQYVLKEVNEGAANIGYDGREYNVTVVLKSIDGKLVATSTVTDAARSNGLNSEGAAVFVNSFNVPSVSVPASATKKLIGRSLTDQDKFTFGMYETGADFVINDGQAPVKTAQNDSDGRISFGSIGHSRVGTHYYVVKEELPEGATSNVINGITYSEEVYYVIVNVEYDQQTHTLVALSENITVIKPGAGPQDSILFTNTYERAPANVKIEGSKILTGDELGSGEFEFALYEEDGSTLIDKTANNANGSFAFALEYDVDDMEGAAEKTFKYVVKEIVPEGENALKGVTYDDSTFAMAVKVTDDEAGTLNAVVQNIAENDGADEEGSDSEIVFRNIYVPDPVTIDLTGTKMMEGRPLNNEEFTFKVYKLDKTFSTMGDVVTTGKNDAAGAIDFDSFKVTEKGESHYIIKEIKPDNADVNMEYDAIEYQVTVDAYDVGGRLAANVTYKVKVVVTNNGTGALSQTVTVDGEERTGATVEFDGLNFTNSYKAVVPEGAGLVLSGQKNLFGDRTTAAANEFTFTLAEVIALDGR